MGGLASLEFEDDEDDAVGPAMSTAELQIALPALPLVGADATVSVQVCSGCMASCCVAQTR